MKLNGSRTGQFLGECGGLVADGGSAVRSVTADCDPDDDLPAGVSRFDVPDRVGRLVEFVRPVDNWRARVIGDPAQLQDTVERGPSGMTVSLEEIGEFRGGLDDAWADLSRQQREALERAATLGYYEQPRKATHREIDAELDCAPQTASDHLQKAEVKVIDAALDEFGPID